VLVAASARPARAQQALTLGEALRIARAHQPAIEAQRAQVDAAFGRRQQALAALLPFVTGSFAYAPTTPNLVLTPGLARQFLTTSGHVTVLDTSGAPVDVACRTPGILNCAPVPRIPSSFAFAAFWAAQLGLSWTFWDWGRSLYGYHSARDIAASAEVGVRTVERDVALNAKLAFYSAASADEQVAVAEDAVKTYNANLAQIRAFHEAGLRTGIDVATSESALASVTITLARARAAQLSARGQLLTALGEDRWRDWTLQVDPAIYEIDAPGDRSAGGSLDDLADQAFARRTELRQLSLQESGLAASVQATRGSYLPALSFSLGPSWGGTDISALANNFTISLGLTYPLGGMSPLLVRGQTREAVGNLVANRAQQRSTRESIREEAIDARALLVSGRDEVLMARTLVDAAARQRALAEGRYKTGVGNVIELYDALLTDVNARFQMVQARLDLASARARLQHALGQDD
jgi:outer membrane protein TolC